MTPQTSQEIIDKYTETLLKECGFKVFAAKTFFHKILQDAVEEALVAERDNLVKVMQKHFQVEKEHQELKRSAQTLNEEIVRLNQERDESIIGFRILIERLEKALQAFQFYIFGSAAEFREAKTTRDEWLRHVNVQNEEAKKLLDEWKAKQAAPRFVTTVEQSLALGQGLPVASGGDFAMPCPPQNRNLCSVLGCEKVAIWRFKTSGRLFCGDHAIQYGGPSSLEPVE